MYNHMKGLIGLRGFKGLRGARLLPVTFLTFSTLLTFLTLSSCSTEKAKWSNIRYHNTTCHYNVWWNGNESLKAGLLKLRKDAADDYTVFLPVEYLGTADAARSINPEMDRAIEKGVKGIKKHSIFVGGEEHVPYIKECYLLTAYATFYKQDYVSTANTCNILISQFKGTHAADEGAVLLARCMSCEKRYSEAEATLDLLVQQLDKGNFQRSQRGKLYQAMVEATVPQEKYKKAVEYIHLALESTSDNNTKARLTFILAQIYQKLDRRPVAAKYYHKVLAYGPPYVMEFNARLGEASCADLEHSDIQKLERQLGAMLRDKKNEEYRDQIYYAMGEMFMGVKNAQKACDNFRRSVAAATVNKAQKAKSALRLGEIYYDVYEDYDRAQLYYDTAMQCITADYPMYSAIKRRSDMLTELCSYTRVYERNDSLLAVAAMPETERNALIQAKIDTLKAQEERAKEKALLEELAAEDKAQQNTLKGDWYFYNQNTVQKGKETFRQRWGTRTLEDYWCLTHKPTFDMFALADSEETAEDSTAADLKDTGDSTVTQSGNPQGNPDDPHFPAYYLKDIPTTQAQFDSIDSLTAISLLNAGYIFYDGIHNIPRALECYLRLASDYTSYDHIVQTFYMLYRIYDRQGNTPQANYYRDMVLMGFPDSDFANLIRDNEYYKELLRRESIVEQAYEELYDQFSHRRYSSVVTLADQASELYGGHPLLHKFNYWKGLALVRLGQQSEAVATFRDIVRVAPRTDSIVPYAQAQINILLSDTTDVITADGNSVSIASAEEKKVATDKGAEEEKAAKKDELPPEAQVFRYREGLAYYVVVLINDRHIRATELQYKLADFNTEYYANSGYKVNAILFTDSTQLITIHRFATENEAMGYYRHLQQAESPLRLYADGDHREFAVSTQNYATFYNRKDPDAYELFFRKYYLNK